MERVFMVLDFGYEMFAGIIAVLVGVGFLGPSKEEIDIRARLLGAASIFCGLIFISDSLEN
jgi:uncharacterized membrane protein HdeD (DUF308 family)